MGTQITNAGVSIQFCNSDGSPDGTPMFAKFAAVRGNDQATILQQSGMGASQEEQDHPGSQDWLTLIAVADTEDKLQTILRDTTVPATEAHTSGSSRRVRLEMKMGGLDQTFTDRITIASGPITSFVPPLMNVVHIKVLAAGTKMTDGHPLIDEFDGMSHLFTVRQDLKKT